MHANKNIEIEQGLWICDEIRLGAGFEARGLELKSPESFQELSYRRYDFQVEIWPICLGVKKGFELF